MSRVQANVVLLFIAVIWGASFTVQKMSVARFLLGAAVVAPVAWLEWRRGGRLATGHWLGLIATGPAPSIWPSRSAWCACSSWRNGV